MDDFDRFERSLATALRSDADLSVGRFEPGTIASTAVDAAQRRPGHIPWGLSGTRTTNRWPAAAAFFIGALVIGGAFFVYQRNQPVVVANPSPTPTSQPSPSVNAVVPPPSSIPAEPSPATTASGFWVATGSMDRPLSGLDAVRLLDGRVLVVGGAGGEFDPSSAALYDPDSATWSSTGTMARGGDGARWSSIPPTLLPDGKVIAGDELYDPDAGTWSDTGKMVQDGDGVTATVLRDGRVLATGPDGCELYDPDTGTWTATGKMVAPRYHHAAALLPDGKVLVAGGLVADFAEDSAEIYDPATGTWTEVASLHAPKADITATLLRDGKVLVTGGADYHPASPPELFDSAIGTWTVTQGMARPDDRYLSATLLSDGTVLMTDPYLAGKEGRGSPLDAELYDPSTGSWSITASMLRADGGSPTLLADGTVLAPGGDDGSAELYVPAGMSPPPAVDANPIPGTGGAWIATGSMGTPRSGHTAARLMDGRVLVASGAIGDEHDTSAELYDPETGTWSATGSMVNPQAGFRATLLRDGRVLVGDTEGAEVYDPASGTWMVTGKMVVTDAYGSAVLLRDGRVLVVHEFGNSELYDPDRGTWTATGQMLEYFHQSRAMVLMPDGKVLEVGGNNGTAYGGVAAELYDPDTGTWTAIADMNDPMEVVSATLLPDGRVLVMDRGFIALAAPEVYDPATGAWTATEPTLSYQSATLLADGTVLAARNDGSPPQAAGLYDPATGSWAATGSMIRPHANAPAMLLLDGSVLVAGGPTRAAELYIPAGVLPPSHAGGHAEPVPTATPTATPVPQPVPPAVGPVPPGARRWTVRVVNTNSRPATLFVAEEDSSGMTRLVGRVAPNVVPPGATVRVTFFLPAKGVRGWSIFVNPGPDTGALLADNSVPLAGEIRIGPDGQPGWLSP